MEPFKVAGVTKKNEKGQEIQTLIKRIAKGYKDEEEIVSWGGMTNKEIIDDGSSVTEFEDQHIGNAISLEKEPDNPYDPNAIKVYFSDIDGEKHHVGYIPKERTSEIAKLMNQNIRFDGEFTGGKVKHIDYDDYNGKEKVVTKTLTNGLLIHPAIPAEKVHTPQKPMNLENTIESTAPYTYREEKTEKKNQVTPTGCAVGCITWTIALIIFFVIIFLLF